MLFNSFEFIFLFLPVTLVTFYLIGNSQKKFKNDLAILWLVVASLLFYGWWNPWNLIIIVCSVLLNYTLGQTIQNRSTKVKKLALATGIVFNLGLISYFKYANFFLDNVSHLVNQDLSIANIVLPLAISFFTFQQIAYLIDAYKGETKNYGLLRYALFVCFFPQLIAGPIVHHKDVLPQFEKSSTYRFNSQVIAIGLTVFVAGLFKKVVFADRIAEYSNLAFGAASQGIPLDFSEAWVGAIAYTLQLYFDFSGYSDMAIGAAFMFGIKLPLNFNSPYKAISIIDFWRRWHITLSHFLRDYLYIPLGGNRKGEFRRYGNLLITMLLGGLWHGAGWTYVFWGGLHGLYLVVNHLWRGIRKSLGHDLKQDGWLLKGMGWLLTFRWVVISWVFFRADNFATALIVLKGMSGINGVQLGSALEPFFGFLRDVGVTFNGFTVNVGISQRYATLGSLLLLAIALLTPNTQQWMGRYSPTLTLPKASKRQSFLDRVWHYLAWRPNRVWSIVMAGLTAFAILGFTRVSEFLYFQF